MSGVSRREHDSACESQARSTQSVSSTRDTNWELIIVSSVLTILIGVFVVYCSKENSVCHCACETDLVLKLSEKLIEMGNTVEELKEKLSQLGM